MYIIAKIIIVFTYVVVTTNSSRITCVQCSATREFRGGGLLPCSGFNWSAPYIIQCPKSTLCYKKTYTVPFSNGLTVQGVEKGCAPQNQMQLDFDHVARKWIQTETVVETVYKEGCSLAENNGRPGEPAEYCYCSSWMCNKSSSIRKISSTTVALHLAAMVLYLLGNFDIL